LVLWGLGLVLLGGLLVGIERSGSTAPMTAQVTLRDMRRPRHRDRRVRRNTAAVQPPDDFESTLADDLETTLADPPFLRPMGS